MITAAAAILTLLLAAFAVQDPWVRAQADLDALVRRVQRSGCTDGLAALAALASGTDLEAPRASYLLGWCLARAGRHVAAAAAYRAAARHPTLRIHARIAEAVAFAQAGDAAQSAALLRELLTITRGQVRARALLALGEAELALGRPSQAVAAITAAAELRDADPSVWLLLGRAAAAAGQRDRARRAYARAAWAFPGDPGEAAARTALARLLERPLRPADIDPESRLLRGRRLAQQGEWAEAAVEFRAVAAAAPGDELGGQAWYRLGEISLRSDLRAAHAAFRRAARLGWNAAGAWYWAYSAARGLRREAQAREAAASLLRAAPTGLWAGRFWLQAGLGAETAGHVATAASSYRQAIAAAPRGAAAAEARWRLGWLALRARQFVDAEAKFRVAAGAAAWPDEAARAWYWAAKALEKAGGPVHGSAAGQIVRLVAERYPLTFYGQRARSRLGLAPPPLSSPPPRVVPREAPAPVYEELARLGLDADAAEAAEDALVQRRDPGLVRFLAETYSRLGEVTLAVRYAEEALASGVRDKGIWRLAYPKAYQAEVTAAANAADIAALLLLALVREESRYDPAAISPAGAVGLAQLMPGTARTMAGGATLTMQQLKAPAVNLALGARYLRLQRDRFHGDLVLALAAYNAGPAAARRWVGLDVDPDYFVEKIGYAETRAFVRRVLESYQIYRLLW